MKRDISTGFHLGFTIFVAYSTYTLLTVLETHLLNKVSEKLGKDEDKE